MSSSYSMPGPWPGGWQQGRAPWLDQLQEFAAMAQRHLAFDAESEPEADTGRRRNALPSWDAVRVQPRRSAG